MAKKKQQAPVTEAEALRAAEQLQAYLASNDDAASKKAQEALRTIGRYARQRERSTAERAKALGGWEAISQKLGYKPVR